MAIVLLLLSLLVGCVPTASSAELDNPLDVDINDPAALQEATRVLADELKLAARPQTYLLIDLVSQAVVIKARGVEMHRLSILRWSVESLENMTGIFRLTARPPIVRRKVTPSAAAGQDPISLSDMPVSYRLAFSSSLTMEIMPPAQQAPLQWALSRAKAWWRWLRRWFQTLSSPNVSEPAPHILLTFSENEAQSLAWSLIDGMPLVIRRPAER
ncbi:MAG: hypothetical protein GDA67_07515 [Nitrospira sp. CR1.3]|nr:hypothetical protein [Nitrospira sp. CR1.3]